MTLNMANELRPNILSLSPNPLLDTSGPTSNLHSSVMFEKQVH